MFTSYEENYAMPNKIMHMYLDDNSCKILVNFSFMLYRILIKYFILEASFPYMQNIETYTKYAS